MDVAWQFRREHLPLSQRSHDVISNGGGQPNVVPDRAAVWYYFREHDFASIKDLYETGNTIADAAALATGTTVDHRLLGYAAPNFGNKPIAEAAYENMKLVGMPKWSADDQTFAREVQVAQHFKLEPLHDTIDPLQGPHKGTFTGGGSDDIGDIMWTVPTITIRYPANIPNTIFHHVTSAMAMATPIAHKGVIAGAKAIAMTVLDLMTTPELIAQSKDYFQNVELKTDTYAPLIKATDTPAIHLNDELMAQMRSRMEPYYYDSKKYNTYLDQLGIKYPNPPTGIRRPDAATKRPTEMSQAAP